MPHLGCSIFLLFFGGKRVNTGPEKRRGGAQAVGARWSGPSAGPQEEGAEPATPPPPSASLAPDPPPPRPHSLAPLDARAHRPTCARPVPSPPNSRGAASPALDRGAPAGRHTDVGWHSRCGRDQASPPRHGPMGHDSLSRTRKAPGRALAAGVGAGGAQGGSRQKRAVAGAACGRASGPWLST